MTNKRLRHLLVAAGLAVAALPAQAVVVSGDFSGVLFIGAQDVNDSLGLGNDLFGRSISGRIAYDTTLAPADANPAIGEAEYHTASLSPQWLTVSELKIGGVPLPPPLTAMPGGSVDQSAQTVAFNTDGSLFGIAYQDAYQTGMGEFVGLTLSLSLLGGPPFASEALPLSVDAADFAMAPFPTGLFALADPLPAEPGERIDIQGSFIVTGLNLSVAGVPAPGALVLLVGGLAALAVAGRHRGQRQRG